MDSSLAGKLQVSHHAWTADILQFLSFIGHYFPLWSWANAQYLSVTNASWCVPAWSHFKTTEKELWETEQLQEIKYIPNSRIYNRKTLGWLEGVFSEPQLSENVGINHNIQIHKCYFYFIAVQRPLTWKACFFPPLNRQAAKCYLIREAHFNTSCLPKLKKVKSWFEQLRKTQSK